MDIKIIIRKDGMNSGYTDEYRRFRDMCLESWRKYKGYPDKAFIYPWPTDLVYWLAKLGYDISMKTVEKNQYVMVIDDKKYLELMLKLK